MVTLNPFVTLDHLCSLVYKRNYHVRSITSKKLIRLLIDETEATYFKMKETTQIILFALVCLVVLNSSSEGVNKIGERLLARSRNLDRVSCSTELKSISRDVNSINPIFLTFLNNFNTSFFMLE